MQFLAIIAMCIVAAVAYGIVHDQVTARICVEYFTIGHPPVFNTDDPTLLGLGWGVYATWWAGLGLGILLARAGRSGNRPPRSLRSLVRPVVLLLLITGLSAIGAGLIGWAVASLGWVVLLEPLASEVPRAKH